MSGTYDVFVGVGEESAWGTLVARTEFNRCYEDSAPDHEAPIGMVTMLGRRDTEVSFKQTEKGSLSIVQPMLYDGMGLILKHALGKVATSGGPTYTHAYTLEDNTYTRDTTPLVGLSMELHMGLPDTNLESFILHGGRCRSFSLNVRTDEEIKFSSEWVGQKLLQLQKTASPTYPTYDSAIVKPKQCAVTLDGTSVPVYGVEFSVSNNLRDDKTVLGSTYISEPRGAGKREITGTIELPWDTTGANGSKAQYDKFIASTSAAIVITCTGTGSDATTITLNNVRFTGKTPGLSEGENTDFSLPFTAFYDATNTALKISQDNATATPATDP